MSTTYPTTIQTMSNPTASDLLENAVTALDHDFQHTTVNDTLFAIQTKMGVTGSAVITTFDYKLSGVVGTDKAVSKTGIETLSNKTLTAPQINMGSDATGDMYYRNGSGVFTRLPAGADGTIISYSAGIPTAIPNPSAADASTTVKGVSEEATSAEVTAGTAVGGTGARLYVNPSTIYTKFAKFGGTGADGALSASSGATNIDLGGVAFVIKNYTSISLTGTASLTFTNPHANGSIVFLKSQGDVTITSSANPTIDLRGMGGNSGTGGVANTTSSATSGSDGSNQLDTGVIHYGGLGGNGSAGVSGVAGTAGLIFASGTIVLYPTTTSHLSRGFIPVYAGAGGGGGGYGNKGGGSGALTSTGGAGGRGGGGLMIECGGAWNFTGVINTSGVAGTTPANPSNPNGTEAGGGGGGGGAAGNCYVLYNSLTANSGTITSAGGNGGNGGTATANDGANNAWGGGGGAGAGAYQGAGGAGGAGAGGSSGANGSNASGTSAGTGGTGGGASGGRAGGGGGGGGGAGAYSLVALNTLF